MSIIMPLYNAGKFLAETLQSVLNQTYRNFELICINDCSTDNTRTILSGFQERDERIRIIDNKERLGAAISRNRGLVAAKGKYVSFLDGDDIFEEEMLERAYSDIEKYGADIVIFDYTHVPSDAIYKKREKGRPDLFYERYCNAVFCIKDFKPRKFPNLSDSPCNKLYRKHFLEENKLEFQNLNSFNDIYFVKMALFCAKKIICLNDKRIMLYARDHFETSRILSERDPMCAYYAMEKLARTLQERDMMKDYAEYLYYAMASKFWYVLIYRKERRNESFYRFLQEEGIAKCIEYGKEFYDRTDSYDKYIIDNFQKKVYESNWFDQVETYFEFYLRQNGHIFREFIHDKLQHDKKIILWGIGQNGTSLLRYLNEYSIKLYAVADYNEEKQGTVICGYEILKPDDICKQVDYILAVGEFVYLYAEEMIKGSNIRLINVITMLTDEVGSL